MRSQLIRKFYRIWERWGAILICCCVFFLGPSRGRFGRSRPMFGVLVIFGLVILDCLYFGVTSSHDESWGGKR